MRKYEAMFIIKPDISEEEKKVLFNQLNESIIKNKGNVVQSGVWSEKRNLIFRIKKYREGIYYLVNFTLEPATITELKNAYKLNEGILRVLITKTG